jgi:hypothetical protein
VGLLEETVVGDGRTIRIRCLGVAVLVGEKASQQQQRLLIGTPQLLLALHGPLALPRHVFELISPIEIGCTLEVLYGLPGRFRLYTAGLGDALLEGLHIEEVL